MLRVNPGDTARHLLPLVVTGNRREGRTGEGRLSAARRGSGCAFWQLPSLLGLLCCCASHAHRQGEPGRAAGCQHHSGDTWRGVHLCPG